MVRHKMNNEGVRFAMLAGILLILPVFSTSAPGSEIYYLWASESGYWSILDNWKVYDEMLGWVPASVLPDPDDYVSIKSGTATVNSNAYAAAVGIGDPSGKLVLIDGSLALSGFLYVELGGSFEQSGGQLSAVQEDVATHGPGIFTQTGGINNIQGNLHVTGPGTEGIYELSGDAELSADCEWITGSFVQTGGTNIVQQNLGLAFSDGSTGTYELSGNGGLSTGETSVGGQGTATFTQTGGSHNVEFGVYIGTGAGGSGTYSLSDGTLVTYLLHIGSTGAAGLFAQAGGTVIADTVFVGWGGNGNVIQTGGDVNVNAIYVPGDPPDVPTSEGKYELHGGNINVEGFISIEEGGSFIMDEGTINASEGADVTVEDGGSLTGLGTFNTIVEYMSKEIYGAHADDSVDLIFEHNSLLVGGVYSVEQISPDELDDCAVGILLDSSAFDVTFDGEFSGEFAICIPYDEAEVAALNADETSLQVLHETGSGTCETLEDVYVDTDENVVYGKAGSLSRFALFVEGVGSPETMLATLRAYIVEQVALSNIDAELEISLLAKVDAAIRALDRGNPNDAKVAMNDLKALTNEVEAQTDKKIAPETAAEIIDRADAISAMLGG